MTKTFATYTDMLNEIAEAIIAMVPGADYGRSERSMSTYVTVTDADGEECKARISDHNATASCSGRIVAELLVDALCIDEITDAFGEFDHIETAHWWVAEEFIETAVAALMACAQEEV